MQAENNEDHSVPDQDEAIEFNSTVGALFFSPDEYV
jgi:hypothetical protein